MKTEQLQKAFFEAILDTDRDRALTVIRKAVGMGAAPEEIIFDIIVPILEERGRAVGDASEMNLAQHFIATQIAAEVTDEMVPRFKKAPEIAGRIVIGTSQGDLHALGKKIVIGCLRAHMVECVDLGVSVPAARFVEEAVTRQARVIGISSMMVHTARGENGCLKVRQLLKERGLEDAIKVVVGGAAYRFDRGLYKTVQADAWAENGLEAGKVVLELIRGY